MVPADSRRIPRVPRYSGYRYAGMNFAKGALTRYGPTFQTVTLAHARTTARSYNPDVPRHTRFGLFPGRSPLLGESLTYFLFLRVLRCFSSPRSPHDIAMMTALRRPGCPIRKSAGQGSFAPNRGLSQLITSFIASVSLGIRHTPLFAFPMKISSHICGTTHSALYFNVVFSTVLLVPICQRSFVQKGHVENNGFEPLTPCLQSRCSSQLS